MTNEALTASRRYSLRRVVGKICDLLARKLPFVPGKLRVLLQKFHGVNFTDWRTVFIGEDVYFDTIYPERITVGRDVRLTAGIRVLTHFLDTQFVPQPGRPFRFYVGDVVIGDGVFIGTGVVIVKPVCIGDWAVIGANSVITKDVPPGAIVAGSPARIVGHRDIAENKKYAGTT